MFKQGDLLICKPRINPDDSFNDFNIYAEVLSVDKKTGHVLLDKYLKCGLLHHGEYNMSTEDVMHYYLPMNNKEKERFKLNHAG